MVEVFKTNVDLSKHATTLLEDLSTRFPLFRINFDLDDCDKILRVEGINIQPVEIIEALSSNGYQCEALD